MHLVDFLPFLTIDRTFVASCLLCGTTESFLKRFTLKGMNLLPLGANSFRLEWFRANEKYLSLPHPHHHPPHTSQLL